ncbi:MAG TPA: GNVR domain-containing protein [Nitrospiraceae bacterium]|nr:GNVR domain-containing protein [Nitrospiraceae bacterium]
MSTIETQSQVYQSGTAVLREYVAMTWRRKWIVIGAVVFSMAVAWAYCVLAPKLYRSETLILVEDQKIPETYVQGVAEGNLEQRIFVIQRQVTSHTLLRAAVKEFNLYPAVVDEFGIDAAIAFLVDSIVVEMVNKGQTGNFVLRSGIDAFTIAFLHEDPGIAMKVTDWIGSKFIEANLKSREQNAESTTEFLDDEVRRVKLELEKRENDVSRFKSTHIGELPQQMEANMRALDRLQTEINAVNESAQRLSDRQSLVQKAIQEYQRFGRTNAAFASGPLEPDPLFRRLKELKEKLIRLKAEFWDTYPEVLLTKDELDQVQKELIAVYGIDVLKPGEKPLDPYLQDLRKQNSELGSELGLLKQRKRLLLTEQKDYETRLEKAPEVEQALLILERDYNNVKNSYTSLLDKRLNARVVENLEKRQKGGQFRILDAANFPRTPVYPNQRRILVFSFIVGCALGVGIVVMKERLNPQFQYPEDVEGMLGPQLLAVIPDFKVELSRMTRLGHLPGSNLPARANGHSAVAAAHAVGWRRLVRHTEAKGPWQEMGFVARWWPNSITGEQYRVAATRLALLQQDTQSTVAAVTSAVKGEGKTTTVVNLGYTLARDLGKRTLLLECDFGRPILHQYIDAPPKWGLADALLSDVPFEECHYGFGDVPCWIMPVGTCRTSVSELLKSERFGHILARCREEFEYILINTPPILPLATMNMLEQYADLLLLVVRASSTTHHVVRRALGSLRANRPLHVILNAVENQSLPNYMYDNYYEQVARSGQPTSSV